MAASDYTGTYNPRRNPNSAMYRVLSNAGYNPQDFTVSMVGPSASNRDDGRDTPVRFEAEEVTGQLIREADKAGYAFVEAKPGEEDTLQVLFRVV